MVRSFSFLFSVMIVVLFAGVSRVYGDYPSAKLLQVTLTKESGNNDQAIGDRKDLQGRPRPSSEWAYGALQIRQPAVDDVNRKFGTHYKSSDCLGNRELSVLIFREYINIYATEKKLGHKPTDVDMAGVWNGGPSGWKSKLTIAYRQDIANKIRKA